MLPTSCKQDQSRVRWVPISQARPLPASRQGLPGSRTAKITLALAQPCPCLASTGPKPWRPHPLTFPCISIRSVRVMLSSGSSSSPASELLILSGGAGATAAWECVPPAAWLVLVGAIIKESETNLVHHVPPLTWGPQTSQIPEKGDYIDLEFQMAL
jgi:hypothetical protein